MEKVILMEDDDQVRQNTCVIEDDEGGYNAHAMEVDSIRFWNVVKVFTPC
jgi:hypothetical protein